MGDEYGLGGAQPDIEERPGTEVPQVNAAELMEEAALRIKSGLEPLSDAIATAPAALLQDLCDANLNAHHALGRLNSARAMVRRPDVNA